MALTSSDAQRMACRPRVWRDIAAALVLASAAVTVAANTGFVATNIVDPLGAVYTARHGRAVIGLPCRVGETDQDGDGICTYDNCPLVPNANQLNTDFDTWVRGLCDV